jgi:Starch-binding associating with outer membrane
MKIKLIKFSLLVTLITFVSCNDYLDINDSPNDPTSEKTPPNLLLAAAQAQTYRLISGDAGTFTNEVRRDCLNQLGNIWMNSWSGNSNNTTGANADEYSVNLTSSFYDGIWDYGYRNITNFHNIANYDSQIYDNHKAIALILKSFYMQYIVDLYGDCPYSQAFLQQKNLSPKYDDDKAIYKNLLTQLDNAILLIKSADSNDKVVSSEDIIMGGNMTNWIKFANTIKLRLLIRQSGLASEQTYINAELDKLAGQEYIDFEVTLNPGYNNKTTANQNPFFAAYGYNISGGASTRRDYVTASKNAADALNGTITSVVDPRRGRLFTLVGGAVVGIKQGDDAAAAPDTPSLLGPAVIPVPATATTPPPGSLLPSYLLTLSEVKFLLAEAALRYPAKFPAAVPQTLFNDGIRASCVRVGVTTANANTYITAINTGNNGYGWGSTNKYLAIMTQKWLALMHVNGIESWIDYVRTGFPSIPLSSTNVTGQPKRLMYPQSEYTSNTTNLPVQSQADALNNAPFWK